MSLGSLGINIRGRSTRLTLNYRTTKQNLAWATRLLRDETYDDMDDGAEGLTGYRSLLRGAAPVMHGFPTVNDELDGVADQVTKWLASGTAPEAIAVCLPTRELVQRATGRLAADGVDAVEITPDGAGSASGVRIGTMHRFKGMEFQRMVIAGVSAGLIPRAGIDRLQRTDPTRYRRELRRDRSLLFVAATRARDDLAIYWHATPSQFLPTP